MEIKSYLCKSPAVPLKPRNSNTIMPPIATKSRKRVRVRKCHIALEGGKRAFADFHETPLFGSNILLIYNVVSSLLLEG